MGTPLDSGMTSFFRCGQCQTLYVPSEGFDLKTGKNVVCWTKPRPRRKPTPCDHLLSSVERWNGETWQSVPVRNDR